MANPVWMDGPLEGQEHLVPDDVVEQGSYRYKPDVVYTFALVEVFFHRLVVASVKTGLVDFPALFERLLTPEAKRAAQQ